MEPSEINELNKLIRAYDGSHGFLKSLQSQLKNSKTYFDLNGRKLKRLSDRQYQSAKDML